MFTRQLTNYFILMAMITVLATCNPRAPIYNPDSIPVLTELSENDIEKAIVKAMTKTGWAVDNKGPGLIMATVSPRQHKATVEIAYNKNSVNIKYKDSVRLKYRKRRISGKELIHHRYNIWVKTLENNIKLELQALTVEGD